MRKMLLLLTAGAFLAAPAFGQSIGEKTGINAMTGVAPKTEDFVKEAAVSDMFEVEAGKLAQSKGQKTKDFGAMLVKDHSATTAELKSLVSGGKVKAQMPTELDSSHKSKLDKLQKLQGADFDKQFADDNVSGHKDDVSLFERYSKGGDNADLKGFAAKTLPTLQAHLKMAQDLNK